MSRSGPVFSSRGEQLSSWSLISVFYRFVLLSSLCAISISQLGGECVALTSLPHKLGEVVMMEGSGVASITWLCGR